MTNPHVAQIVKQAETDLTDIAAMLDVMTVGLNSDQRDNITTVFNLASRLHSWVLKLAGDLGYDFQEKA